MAKSHVGRTSELEYDGMAHQLFSSGMIVWGTATGNQVRLGGAVAQCDLDIVKLIVKVAVKATAASAKLRIALNTDPDGLFLDLSLQSVAAGVYEYLPANSRFVQTTIAKGDVITFGAKTATAVGQCGAVLIAAPRNA